MGPDDGPEMEHVEIRTNQKNSMEFSVGFYSILIQGWNYFLILISCLKSLFFKFARKLSYLF